MFSMFGGCENLKQVKINDIISNNNLKKELKENNFNIVNKLGIKI